MSATPSSVLKPTALHSAVAHFHVSGENCPFCEQRIPQDRFEEIKERIQLREQERSDIVTMQLQARFTREKSEALEQAQQQSTAALDAERAQGVARLAVARAEERQAADAAAAEKIAAAEQANQAAQAQMQARIDQSEAAKLAAEQSGAALQAQLDQARRDNEEAIEKVKQDAAANAVTIEAEARQRAEEGAREKIANLERAYQESAAGFQTRIDQAQADKAAAEEARRLLQEQMEQTRRESEAAVEKMKQEAAAQVVAARHEATAAAEAGMQTKIADAEQARAAAEEKAAAAAQQVQTLQAAHDVQVAERLVEQREALEHAHAEALAAEKSAAFDEKMKWSTKVDDLQRALAKKTADELGDMAEVDLYEALKAEFDGDRIERINKGQPGADILHVVIHNGKECGSIIYDSKNHNGWRNDFVTKLADDQLAAKAEHAILSTRKFPTGCHQLHVQDGVILAVPARIVALVTVVRQHIIQSHTLRLSNEARAKKTEELYTFIISEQAADLFARIDTHMDDLLDLQVKEKKAHDAVWKKQGELFRSVQKVKGQLCNEIDLIIGTAGGSESAPRGQENGS